MDLRYLILLHSIGCSIRQYYSSIFLKGSLDIYLNQLANLRNVLVPVSLLGLIEAVGLSLLQSCPGILKGNCFP